MFFKRIINHKIDFLKSISKYRYYNARIMMYNTKNSGRLERLDVQEAITRNNCKMREYKLCACAITHPARALALPRASTAVCNVLAMSVNGPSL